MSHHPGPSNRTEYNDPLVLNQYLARDSSVGQMIDLLNPSTPLQA
jgi:hypothetical protein